MNKDEAERARDLAKAALGDGKFEKALRLSKRALTLHESLEETPALWLCRKLRKH